MNLKMISLALTLPALGVVGNGHAQSFTNLPFSTKFEVSASTLAGNAFSTGPVRAAGQYTVHRAEIETDIAGTLAIQTSTTTNTALFLDFATVGVSSGAPTSLEIDLTAPYVRSIFRNGATDQTRFYHREVLQLWP